MQWTCIDEDHSFVFDCCIRFLLLRVAKKMWVNE